MAFLTDKVEFDIQPTEPSPLLSLNYFGQALPVNLEITDIFKAFPEDMSEGFPRRVIYDETKDMYIYADLYHKATQIYLIHGPSKNHQMLGCIVYSYSECPIDRQFEEVADICIHPSDDTCVIISLLVLNTLRRTAYLVRFKVDLSVFSALQGNTDCEDYFVKASDLLFTAKLIPSGAVDDIAVPSVDDVDHNWVPQFEQAIPKLKQSMVVGALNRDFCGLTCTDTGRYIILLQSTVTLYASPFLTCPIDVQYLVSLDEGGMHYTWKLVGPLNKCITFDEETEGQPYLKNPTIIDGRYLLCNEIRYSRELSPHTFRISSSIIEHITGTQPWGGGWVAGLYFPALIPLGNSPGYASAWKEPVMLTPIRRESIWRMLDTADIDKLTDTELITQFWEPVTLHHYPVVTDEPPAFTVFGNFAATNISDQVVRFNVEYLVFYAQAPENGGVPQSSIYITGLIPNHTITQTYIIKNVSHTCYARYITHVIENCPEDVTVVVTGLPSVLAPQASATITITATYNPLLSVKPKTHLEVVLSLSYYLVSNTSATAVTPPEEPPTP